MARPKSDGLLYFPFDTDFFFADRRVKALRARYDNDGVVLYIYLLAEIYRNGYNIKWDEDSEDNAMADLNISEGLIKQVIQFLVSRSLLTSILVDSDTYITSPGIQKRYQEAVKGLKRDVFVNKDLWLLDKEETAAFIKFAQKNDISQKNKSKSQNNESKSQNNSTNEMKENEMKENEMNLNDVFEHLWTLYPNKKGKGKVSDATKKRLYEIGFGEIVRAIDRYKSEWEKEKEWRKMQNGSTFFNSGYIDYLDANYVPSENRGGEPKPNQFNNFEQRKYTKENYAEMERRLLNRG